MKTYLAAGLAGGVLVSCCVLVSGTGVSLGADDATQPKDLRLFYQQNCAGCHGADGSAKDSAGKGLSGEDFTNEKWLKGASDENMAKVILDGKFFGLAMPAYKKALTKAEALRMVTEVLRKSEKGKTIEPASKAAESSK
jgi:mono/diheme cytochrome c family protein